MFLEGAEEKAVLRIAYSNQKLTSQHVPVCAVSDGKKMRGHLSSSLAQVHLDGGWGVNRVPLVRVHNNAEQARVGLKQAVTRQV